MFVIQFVLQLKLFMFLYDFWIATVIQQHFIKLQLSNIHMNIAVDT